MALSGKQRRHLRALGHHLQPVVQVGQEGVTPGLVAAAEQALFDHELIKVRFADGPEDRHQASRHLAEETQAEIAQVLGKTLLLYKVHPEKPKIKF